MAEYFTHQPRRDFPTKVNDCPNGASQNKRCAVLSFRKPGEAAHASWQQTNRSPY